MQAGHLDQNELSLLASARGQGAPNFEAYNAHLNLCPACRGHLRARMLMETPTASQWLKAADQDDSFAACLHDEEALRLIRNQLDALEQETIGFHLEECHACRTLIADLQAFAAAMQATPDRLAIEPTGSAAVETSKLRSWEETTSWLDRLGAQIASALERFRPAGQAYGFASSPADTLRQPLEFSRTEFFGSYRAEGDVRLLHLEHTSYAPGALILLEAVNASNQVTWRCLAVLRKGMRRSILDVETDFRADLCTLRVGLLAPAFLTEQICAALPSACAATGRDRCCCSRRLGELGSTDNCRTQLFPLSCRCRFDTYRCDRRVVPASLLV